MSENPTAPPDRTTSNKAAFIRSLEAMNSGDRRRIDEAIDELFAPDVILRTPIPIRATGSAALKQVWSTLLTAFPDLHVSVDTMVAEDDKVVISDRVTGTHRGEYLGLAPTGRSVAYDEMFILRFERGRVVETWGVIDVLAQRRQLGLIQP